MMSPDHNYIKGGNRSCPTLEMVICNCVFGSRIKYVIVYTSDSVSLPIVIISISLIPFHIFTPSPHVRYKDLRCYLLYTSEDRQNKAEV